MTARVYRAEDDPRRTDAVLVAVIEAHLRAAPDCGTTHHTGCACHEARRDARRSRIGTEQRWCLHCGATWGTQHIADCPVGRALRVLDGGAR